MNEQKNNDVHFLFGNLLNSMNHFFQEKPIRGFLQTIDDFFINPFPLSSFHVELDETDTEYIVTAKLPGIKKEQIQLDIYDRYITITVHYEEESREENAKKQMVKMQHSIQRTSRTIPFPYPINEKEVHGSYENGLLQIRAAKPKGKRLLLD